MSRKEGPVYTCNVCDKQFFRKHHFGLHMRNHAGERPFSCDRCDKSFFWKSCLVQHQLVHTGERRFTCETCQKKFTRMTHLRSHMIGHSDEKPFVCGTCQKGFARREVLERHLRIHTGERPYACKFCGQRFTQSTTLTIHLRLHTGEKPYACRVCQRRFTTKSNLTKHLLCHSVENPFTCKVCNTGFRTELALSTHLITHNEDGHAGEAPHVCNVCRKAFSLKEDLDSHNCIPPRGKQFVCNRCRKAFSLKRSLDRHLCIPFGEKPFKCQICKMAFRVKSGLSSHLKAHAREKPGISGSARTCLPTHVASKDNMQESVPIIEGENFPSFGKNITIETDSGSDLAPKLQLLTNLIQNFLSENHLEVSVQIDTDGDSYSVNINTGNETDAWNTSGSDLTPKLQRLTNLIHNFFSVHHLEGNVHIDSRENSQSFCVTSEKEADACDISVSDLTPKPQLQSHLTPTSPYKNYVEGKFHNNPAVNSHSVSINTGNATDVIITPGSDLTPKLQQLSYLIQNFLSENHLDGNIHIDPDARDISISALTLALPSEDQGNSHIDDGATSNPFCATAGEDTCDLSESNFTPNQQRPLNFQTEYRLQGNTLIRVGGNMHPFHRNRNNLYRKSTSAAKDKLFRCNVCIRAFAMKYQLDLHLNVHKSDKQHICGLCKEAFLCKYTLNRHVEETHKQEGEEPYVCDTCDRRYKKFALLVAHRRVHTGEKPYKCTYCERAFSRIPDLRRHMPMHTCEKPFVCNICKKAFTRKTSLKFHLLMHTEERPFACEICNKVFRFEVYYKRHLLRTHDKGPKEKPYSCDVCQEAFSAKRSLIRHRSTHSEKPFVCHICNEAFIRKSKLLKHLVSTHPEETSSALKKHVCNVCQKTFVQKKDLQCHMYTHDKKRPFVCQVCNKAFRQKSHLSKHLVTHARKKPEVCNLSENAITQEPDNTTLEHIPETEHTQELTPNSEHTQELTSNSENTPLEHTPYSELTPNSEKHVCNFCQRVFTQKAELSAHFLSSHRIAHFFPVKNRLKEQVSVHIEENSHSFEEGNSEVVQEITPPQPQAVHNLTVSNDSTVSPQSQTVNNNSTVSPQSQTVNNNATVSPQSQATTSTSETTAKSGTERLPKSQKSEGMSFRVAKKPTFVKCDGKLYLVTYI